MIVRCRNQRRGKMTVLTRYQNPVVGSTIALKLFARNSNNFANLNAIDHIDILKESCTNECAPSEDKREDGRERSTTLIQTIPSSQVIQRNTGIYTVDLTTSAPEYTVGRYEDVWWVQFAPNDPLTPFKQEFQLNSDLWVLTGSPVVYSFDFRFTPNRIRHGSIKYLIIQIIPNVPRQTDLIRYYENLAISAILRINIEQNCGPCLPSESDLRLVVDNDLVLERDKVFSYYQIDTTDWECGIYNVWFELDFAGSVEVGQKGQLQIF